MYGFDEGMLVTMDLGDPTIKQDNMDIWVLVDTLPILPPCVLEICPRGNNKSIIIFHCS